jgi:gliding motility-associated-like protein
MLKLWLALLLITIGVFGKLQASHIVGGVLQYENLGSDSYRITLKVYRDCFNSSTDFDDPAAVGIFNAAGDLIQTVILPLAEAQISDVPINNLGPCLEPPTNVCVKEAIYSTIIFLPNTIGGYSLSYQRCCRNSTLVNTTSNDDLGITLTTQIPGIELNMINSNPSFVQLPPLVLCLNQPFTFDHSATDADGDLLVYEFCSPLLTNVPGFYINPPGAPDYPPLNFNPGYSANYPIDSDPAFTIDPVTGLLSGTPTLLGQFVVGVCVSEFRNGQLLSTTNRDFQFNVTLCGTNTTSSFVEPEPCTGLEATFVNESTNAFTWFWDFGVAELTNDTSILEDPVYLYPDTGWYEVTLIVNPNTICADTSFSLFHALPDLDLQWQAPDFECLNTQRFYDFGVTGNLSSNAIVSWDLGASATPSTANGIQLNNVLYSAPFVPQTITVTAQDFGCTESITVELDLPPDPIPIIEEQASFCDGFIYTMGNLSQHATDYEWSFNFSPNPAWVNQFEPTITFPGEGQYIIGLTASAEFTCPQYTDLPFEIFGNLQPFFEAPADQCFSLQSFQFTAEGNSSEDAIFSWQFENGLTSSLSNPQNIVMGEPGWYNVTLTIAENGCEESYTDSVRVVVEPVITFDLQPTASCPPLSIIFTPEVSSETPVFFSWDFGTGDIVQTQNPTYTYTTPGIYDVGVQAFTTNGCVYTLDTLFDDLVTIYPLPSPAFQILPSEVDISNPVTFIESLSPDADSCYYLLEDGSFSTECSFEHVWQEAGRLQVTQFVFNEFGCMASTLGEVLINGFQFYAPNSFTPNGDGVNDVWLPITVGIGEYNLTIFNRWGELIFQTSSPDSPWLGQWRDGEHYVQNETYPYRVRLTDRLGNPYEFVGHINAIR